MMCSICHSLCCLGVVRLSYLQGQKVWCTSCVVYSGWLCQVCLSWFHQCWKIPSWVTSHGIVAVVWTIVVRPTFVLSLHEAGHVRGGSNFFRRRIHPYQGLPGLVCIVNRFQSQITHLDPQNGFVPYYLYLVPIEVYYSTLSSRSTSIKSFNSPLPFFFSGTSRRMSIL